MWQNKNRRGRGKLLVVTYNLGQQHSSPYVTLQRIYTSRTVFEGFYACVLMNAVIIFWGFFLFYLKTRFTRTSERFVLPADLVLWNVDHVNDRTYVDKVEKTITSHIRRRDAGPTTVRTRLPMGTSARERRGGWNTSAQQCSNGGEEIVIVV